MLPIFSQAASILGKLGGGRRIAPIVKKPRRVPLNVERLEDRTVPSADPLQAMPDLAATTQNTAVNIAVLANDTGPGPLTVVSVTQANLGPATVNADNTINYVALGPAQDTFSYTITNGSAQATGQVTVYVLATEYDVYLWKVSQADLAYTNAMEAAHSERLELIESARAAAIAQAGALYSDYLDATSQAQVAYDAATTSIASNYQATIQQADVPWRATYEEAWALYTSAMASPQQTKQDAVFAAKEAYETAGTLAVDAYETAVIPNQLSLDAAYAVLLANPDDPDAQAAFAQAQTDLDVVASSAIVDWQAAIESALGVYLGSLDEAYLEFNAAEDAAQLALDESMAPADEAWWGVHAPAWSVLVAAMSVADNDYVSAEGTAWDIYVNALTALESNLTLVESTYQSQFEDRSNGAILAWYSAEQTAWNSYLANLAILANPPAQGQEILAPAAVVLAPVEMFAGLLVGQREELVLLAQDPANPFTSGANARGNVPEATQTRAQLLATMPRLNPEGQRDMAALMSMISRLNPDQAGLTALLAAVAENNTMLRRPPANWDFRNQSRLTGGYRKGVIPPNMIMGPGGCGPCVGVLIYPINNPRLPTYAFHFGFQRESPSATFQREITNPVQNWNDIRSGYRAALCGAQDTAQTRADTSAVLQAAITSIRNDLRVEIIGYVPGPDMAVDRYGRLYWTLPSTVLVTEY